MWPDGAPSERDEANVLSQKYQTIPILDGSPWAYWFPSCGKFPSTQQARATARPGWWRSGRLL